MAILQVTVTATDNGYPNNLRSTCRLLVTVNDTNDNPPLFTNPSRNDATVYATILRDDVITRIQVLCRFFTHFWSTSSDIQTTDLPSIDIIYSVANYKNQCFQLVDSAFLPNSNSYSK